MKRTDLNDFDLFARLRNVLEEKGYTARHLAMFCDSPELLDSLKDRLQNKMTRVIERIQHADGSVTLRQPFWTGNYWSTVDVRELPPIPRSTRTSRRRGRQQPTEADVQTALIKAGVMVPN